MSFSYSLGAGFVYYSTIPLDCYLAGSGCAANVIAANLQQIYTPSVLAYTHALKPPLRFLPPVRASDGRLPLLPNPFGLQQWPVASGWIAGDECFTVLLPCG